jgi:superfamily I DNA/RNA helicase
MKPILSPEQKEIVEFLGAPMRVLAGPGTGKTFCLIERMSFLTSVKKVSHNEICAITFTNAAADKIRGDLLKSGVKSDLMPYTNTVHSFAMSILQKHQKRASLKPGFRPIGNNITSILIKDVIHDIGNRGIKISKEDLKIYKGAHFQNRAGAGLPDEIGKNPQKTKILSTFSSTFKEHLDFYNAMDWADILEKAIDLIDGFPDIKEDVHKRTQYLLVDEYQDLSPIEQHFVDKACGNCDGLCVVGDDDQSIYESFRFADPNGIIKIFLEKYKNGKPFFITTCRRCPPEVVKYANKLIKNNIKRVDKDLIPLKREDGKEGFVVAVSHKSKVKEKEWLVSKVEDLLKKKVSPKEIMILFPDGDTAKDYVFALKEKGIPINVTLKVAHPFETPEFLGLISLARFLNNTDDNLSLRQFLVFWKGIGPETVRQVRLNAIANSSSFWDIVSNIAENPDAFKNIKLRKEVAEIHSFVKELLKITNLFEVIEKIFSRFAELNDDTGSKILYEYFQKFRKAGELVSFKEILNSFERGMESGELENKDEEEKDAVRIMTMHSAKGLDASIVIIPALEDDIMPGNAQNVEEKRRLFYVSMTRAKFGLFLSWANQRSGPEIHKVPGRTMLSKKKSRFLQEIGL